MEYLLDSGADIDAVDNDGWEPIHAAACWGQVLYIERQFISGVTERGGLATHFLQNYKAKY